MGDLLGNLAFVVIAILAWIVKEAVERKEQKQAPQQRRKGGQAPEAETSTSEEVDLVYGRRKIPETLTAGPAPTARKSSAAAAEPAAPRKASKEKSGGRLVSFEGHRLRTQIAVTAGAAAFTEGAGRHGDAWARLGLAHSAERRNAVRMGILWSEVLGPPRAIQGPHRSPVLKRRRRR